jgi:leader peptidase (prepilin peptidase) / N-methyltransferase
MIRILGTIFAGLLGLAFGSFLNVCLSRWPEGESVVKPRSHCRNCDHTLAWWENIPLVSWLALRGRCRKCGAAISWRYPFVELAVCVIWALAAFQTFPVNIDSGIVWQIADIYSALTAAVGWMILCWFLIALAALDAESLWLPNFLTGSGFALGIGAGLVKLVLLLIGAPPSGMPFTRSLMSEYGGVIGVFFSWLFGILFATLLILLIRWIYELIRKREGMGLGDAKLMALLAAWLGLPGALLAFGLGAILGSIVALALLILPASRRGSETWAGIKLPFGTFLCIGGIVSSLWGQPMINAYLRWAGF